MEGVVGHERALAGLERALREGRLAHAYLFSGPPRVGKATVARRLAQALICADETPPCLRCRACRLIDEGRHPDVEVVAVGGICEEGDHRDHATDGSRDIRICQVRRLERIVSRSPFEAPWRVVIIDPADALTVEAANALLKTLEEPPPRVVLVLVTAREEALPPTVRSRCRRVPFAALPVGLVEEALVRHWSAEAGRARKLAQLSDGHLGWAVAAAQDEAVLSDREADLDELAALPEAALVERLEFARRLGGEFSAARDGVLSKLDLWREWWRDVLLTQAGLVDRAVNADRLDKLTQESRQYGQPEVVRFLQDIERARQQLEDNVNPLLALEVLALSLPAPAGRKETAAPRPRE